MLFFHLQIRLRYLADNQKIERQCHKKSVTLLRWFFNKVYTWKQHTVINETLSNAWRYLNGLHFGNLRNSLAIFLEIPTLNYQVHACPLGGAVPAAYIATSKRRRRLNTLLEEQWMFNSGHFVSTRSLGLFENWLGFVSIGRRVYGVFGWYKLKRVLEKLFGLGRRKCILTVSLHINTF